MSAIPEASGPSAPGPARPALQLVEAGRPVLHDRGAEGAAPPNHAGAAVAGRPGGLSLGLLVPGLATLILAAAQVLSAWIAERHSVRLMRIEQEARLLSEARQVSLAGSTALLDEFPELRLVPALVEYVGDRPEVVAAVVVDGRDVVRGDMDARAVGRTFAPDQRWEPIQALVPLRDGESLLGDDRVMAARVPVWHVGGQRIGTAIVALRRAEIEATTGRVRGDLGLALIVMLACGSLAMIVLMRRVVAPVAGLRRGLECIGRGELDGRIRPRGAAEFRMLAGALNDMSARLRDAQSAALERERLSGEMAAAGRLHRSLLPGGRFTSGDFLMVGAHRASEEVGGDYYDFLTRPDGRIALVIADVAGKGVAASLVMSMLASLMRAFAPGSLTPSGLLLAIETHLGPSLRRESFVTVWCAILDPDTGRVVFASAGHLPALIVRADGSSAAWMSAAAAPIGVAGPAGLRRQVADQEVTLERGDLLVQFTDGITEAQRAGDGELFGFERMEAVVRSHAPQGVDAVVRALLDAVHSWTGGEARDDETLLVVSRTRGAADPSALPMLPEDVLACAEGAGRRLALPADASCVGVLHGWIESNPAFSGLGEEGRRRLELALYELTANIVEHGYRRSEAGGIDVWWVPSAPGDERARAARSRVPLPGDFFIIRDHGRPFDPGRTVAPDLSDPAARRAGRGLGLELVRRLQARTRYFPSSHHGNLTLVQFEVRRTPEDSDA